LNETEFLNEFRMLPRDFWSTVAIKDDWPTWNAIGWRGGTHPARAHADAESEARPMAAATSSCWDGREDIMEPTVLLHWQRLLQTGVWFEKWARYHVLFSTRLGDTSKPRAQKMWHEEG
jgi:hypothetical protein